MLNNIFKYGAFTAISLTMMAGAEQTATEKAAAAGANIFAPENAAPVLSAKEQAAVTAAVGVTKEWLAVVDSGAYAKAWQGGSGYFRATVKSEQFEQKMQSLRQPLGKVLSRTTARTYYRTKLPGMADGEYVVIKFITVFENKPSTTETTTFMVDKDGQWRAAGYFIKINEQQANPPRNTTPSGNL